MGLKGQAALNAYEDFCIDRTTCKDDRALAPTGMHPESSSAQDVHLLVTIPCIVYRVHSLRHHGLRRSKLRSHRCSQTSSRASEAAAGADLEVAAADHEVCTEA